MHLNYAASARIALLPLLCRHVVHWFDRVLERGPECRLDTTARSCGLRSAGQASGRCAAIGDPRLSTLRRRNPWRRRPSDRAHGSCRFPVAATSISAGFQVLRFSAADTLVRALRRRAGVTASRKCNDDLGSTVTMVPVFRARDTPLKNVTL